MSQFSKLVKEVKSDLEEGKEEDKAHIERITYEKIQNKNLSHIIGSNDFPKSIPASKKNRSSIFTNSHNKNTELYVDAILRTTIQNAVKKELLGGF